MLATISDQHPDTETDDAPVYPVQSGRRPTTELTQEFSRLDTPPNKHQDLGCVNKPTNALLTHLIGHTAMAIAIVRTPDWIINLANPAMCQLCGRSEAQSLGQPISILLPEASQVLEQDLLDVFGSGQAFLRAAYTISHLADYSPEQRYLDLNYEPFWGADGVLSQIIVTITNVTAQVQARQLTEKLLAEKRDLHQLEANFVTLASHEFRTPMGTILSSASLIGRYNGAHEADKRERHVQLIKRAVASLNELLTNFLALGQSGQPDQAQPLTLPVFCRHTLAHMQAIGNVNQQVVYRHVAGEPSVTINGNLLKHLLINLLLKASECAPEGKAIELTTCTTGPFLLIKVQNIESPEKDILLASYFQGNNPMPVPSMGLSQYILDHHVDLLGGTITLTNQLGGGIVVTVQIPL